MLDLDSDAFHDYGFTYLQLCDVFKTFFWLVICSIAGLPLQCAFAIFIIRGIVGQDRKL